LKHIDLDELAWVFKSLGYRRRLEILNLLIKGGQMSVSDISESLKMPLASVSQNLAVLGRAGLVTPRRKGCFVFYKIKRIGISARHMLLLWLVLDAFEQKDTDPVLVGAISDIASGNYKRFFKAIGLR
jgi:DNA-binding transcriptional ArsR family regulator